MTFEHFMDLAGKAMDALLLSKPLWSPLGKAWLLGMIAWEVTKHLAERGDQAQESESKPAAPAAGIAGPCAFKMSCDGLSKEAEAMKSCGTIAAEIAEELEGVQLTGSGLSGVNRALRGLRNMIRAHAMALDLLSENLHEIRALYTGAEDRISAAYSGN